MKITKKKKRSGRKEEEQRRGQNKEIEKQWGQNENQVVRRPSERKLKQKELRKTRCHAIAGRTARCRYKFRHNGIVHAVTVVQHGFLV